MSDMLRPSFRVSQQNLASEETCLKVVLSFFEFFFLILDLNFKKFFWISNGKNTLFTKVLKKWSRFRKKNKIFFSITGGGGPGPYMEFSIIFFLNPSPYCIYYPLTTTLYIAFTLLCLENIFASLLNNILISTP